MSHYIVELALWTFTAYFLGCGLGHMLRSAVKSGGEKSANLPRQ